MRPTVPQKPKGTAALSDWLDQQKGIAPGLPLEPERQPEPEKPPARATCNLQPDPATHPKPWPRLSTSLPGCRDPRFCQSCMTSYLQDAIYLWREMDEDDKPTDTLIALCEACDRRLIGPHPRLYERLRKNQPVPGGIAALCGRCQWYDIREGLTCTHPDQRKLGGPGLQITYPDPIQAFVDGKGFGGKVTIFPAPASACAGLKEDRRQMRLTCPGERALPVPKAPEPEETTPPPPETPASAPEEDTTGPEASW